MKIAKIILRSATASFDKVYSYAIPDHLRKDAIEGRRVLIPFGRGNRLTEGFIYALDEVTEIKEDTLKMIHACLDPWPLLKQSQRKLLFQMKQRYGCTFGSAASLMIPSGAKLRLEEDVSINPHKKEDLPQDLLDHFRDEKKEISIPINDLLSAGFSRSELFEWEKQDLIQIKTETKQQVKSKTVEFCKLADTLLAKEMYSDASFRSIQQERVIEFLLENEEVEVQDLLLACDVRRGTLRTLQKYNLLEFYRIPWVETDHSAEIKNPTINIEGLLAIPYEKLNEDQKNAVDRIASALQKTENSTLTSSKCQEEPNEFLLFGVTGSGKTEVYMHAAQAALSQGKTCIILVPEISLTPQITALFEARFPDEVVVLHSRLTPRQRYDRWEKVHQGQVKIVVGARSAIFTPLENLGLIIIDEEQEESYQSDMNPRYHAATIARLRSRNEDAILVLGSATPSLESFCRTKENKSILLELKKRTGDAQIPESRLIDLRRSWNSETEGMLSVELIQAMEKAFSKNEQVILFLNRRGYAGVASCQSCGKNLECPNCSIGMTYHKKQNRFICHYCGHIERLQNTCPACGEEALILHGSGTQKLEEICQKRFPGVHIVRMDQDQTAGPHSHAKLLKEFREAGPAILIGTQMIAKGHDFERVSVSAVISADQILSRNDIRAAEKTFQLVTQTSGRAGRKNSHGQAFIQAFDLDHYAIQTAVQNDYRSFVKQEIAFRKNLQYPPFQAMANLQVIANSESLGAREARNVYQKIHALVQKQFLNIEVLQPIRSSMYKLQGTWRWQIILRTKKIANVQDLSIIWQIITLEKPIDGIRFSYTLDPA